MAISADFAKVLDKAYEDKSLDEILSASPAALAGVTDKDAQLLQEAFGIKTVADLGRNKYFRVAQALHNLSEASK